MQRKRNWRPQSGTLALRICQVLRHHHARIWTPKALAPYVSADRRTVSKELTRIMEKQAGNDMQWIIKVPAGYRSFIDRRQRDRMEVVELKCHSFQVSCTMPSNRGWGAPGATRAWGDMRSPGAWDWSPSNRQFITSQPWRQYRCTVAVTPGTGTVQVSLKSSEDPLGYEVARDFLTWLEGAMVAWGLQWWTDRAKVDNIEYNDDFRTLQLEGAKGVKVRAFLNELRQVYQKDPDRLRAESRWWHTEDRTVSVAEAVSWMQPNHRQDDADSALYIPSGDEPEGMFQ